MKILYTPKRLLLIESMAELKEFNTVCEMLDWIVSSETEIFGKEMFSKTDINLSYYCYDERIDWETFIVTINKYGNENYLEKYQSPMAIGFMTFKYEENYD